MEIRKNESLKAHTTIKIGGKATNFYIPENTEELRILTESLCKYRILSAGSNLLINDSHDFENVIYMGKVDNKISNHGAGVFYCGASVRVQKLIHEIHKSGYGGIEELISIPGMIGGLIFMNASIGNDVVCLTDYLERVYAIKDSHALVLSKEECCFGHRSSIFQKESIIITGAEFKFPLQDEETSRSRLDTRQAVAKDRQDHSGYNFGSL